MTTSETNCMGRGWGCTEVNFSWEYESETNRAGVRKTLTMGFILFRKWILGFDRMLFSYNPAIVLPEWTKPS